MCVCVGAGLAGGGGEGGCVAERGGGGEGDEMRDGA